MPQIYKILLQLILVIIAGELLTSSVPPPQNNLSSDATPTVAQSDRPGTQTSQTTATPAPADVIRLAWFYKPPDATQMELVGNLADFFILTHKDEPTVAAFKAQGVTVPFSQYLLLAEIHNPGDCSDGPRGNQVAYKEGDFCAISNQHPDWFLLDKNGEPIGDEDTAFMDPGSDGYRAFWVERARELQETHGWQTIFLDNIEASRSKWVKDKEALAKYPDDESYQRAVEGFLDYIRQNYFEPQGKPMYGNIVSVDDDAVWDRYLDHLDGAMIESFATDWDRGFPSRSDWEQQMDQAEQALRRGKTLILVAQGQQQDLELQNFAFASYLLIADGNAYFRYAHSDSYGDWWMYENYELDLGLPVGERYEEKGLWQRDFENGHVIVNPQKQQAQIVINP